MTTTITLYLWLKIFESCFKTGRIRDAVVATIFTLFSVCLDVQILIFMAKVISKI